MFRQDLVIDECMVGILAIVCFYFSDLFVLLFHSSFLLFLGLPWKSCCLRMMSQVKKDVEYMPFLKLIKGVDFIFHISLTQRFYSCSSFALSSFHLSLTEAQILEYYELTLLQGERSWIDESIK